MRLWWAGHEEMGGILCVASTSPEALARAHDEICDCDNAYECFGDGGWSATDVASTLGQCRLVLVHRPKGIRGQIVQNGAVRLWWVFGDSTGGWYAAESERDALRQYCDDYACDPDDHGMETQIVRRVDGYDVLVCEAQVYVSGGAV